MEAMTTVPRMEKPSLPEVHESTASEVHESVPDSVPMMSLPMSVPAASSLTEFERQQVYWPVMDRDAR